MSNFPHEGGVLLRPSNLLLLSGKENHATKKTPSKTPIKPHTNKNPEVCKFY